MFFSFDGVDGAGKTTQLDLFCESLAAEGRPFVRCVDPGSTPLGERLRSLLLDERELRIDRTAEMLLFMAARAQMVDELIQPALARGEIIVSDRYLLANVVYQGHALGLDVAKLWDVGAMVTRGAAPDLTFVLDLPPDAASDRIARPLDRMESRGDEFQRRLRAGYLAEAARSPESIAIIDGRPPAAEVHREIRRLADERLRRVVASPAR
jgi:dTMP kinase